MIFASRCKDGERVRPSSPMADLMRDDAGPNTEDGMTVPNGGVSRGDGGTMLLPLEPDISDKSGLRSNPGERIIMPEQRPALTDRNIPYDISAASEGATTPQNSPRSRDGSMAEPLPERSSLPLKALGEEPAIKKVTPNVHDIPILRPAQAAELPLGAIEKVEDTYVVHWTCVSIPVAQMYNRELNLAQWKKCGTPFHSVVEGDSREVAEVFY